LEFENGTLRSTFWLFWPKKKKRNSISKMKSVWTCRRSGNLLYCADPPMTLAFRSLSICGSCGVSKEWNVLDLSRGQRVSWFWFGGGPTPPPGPYNAGTDRHWECSSLNISNYFLKKEFDSNNILVHFYLNFSNSFEICSEIWK
jgi:hypothetical protein